jgi:hypothetical protein
MFTKEDTMFEEMAADPIRRRAGIASLSLRCTIIFWCAMTTTTCALVGSFASLAARRAAAGSVSTGSVGAALLVFAAAVHWGICFKMGSDLRLLRVIERLQSGGDDSQFLPKG